MLIELIPLGLIVGFLAGIFGIGGGTVLIPALLLMDIPIKTAIGISVMQMMLTSFFGSYLHHKKGGLHYREAITLGLGGAVGAMFSGYIVSVTPGTVLQILFTVLVGFGIVKLYFSPSEPPAGSQPVNNPTLLFGLGAAVGMCAISLGVGGALMLNPLLVAYLRYSLKHAVAISLFFVMFSSVSGFFSLAWHGHVDYSLGLIVGISSLAGVYLGVKTLKAIRPKHHKQLLSALYVIILLSLLVKLVEMA